MYNSFSHRIEIRPKYLPCPILYIPNKKQLREDGGNGLEGLISELRCGNENERYHCYKLPKISVVSMLEKRREKSPVQNTS